MNCFKCFSSEKILNQHEVCLGIYGKQATKMCQKDSNAQFTIYHRQPCEPFEFYADLGPDLKVIQKFIKNNLDELYAGNY